MLRSSPLSSVLLLSFLFFLLLLSSSPLLTSAQSPQPIRAGQSLIFQVGRNDWSYYTFTNTITAGATVTIGITAQAGDPDLYYHYGSYPTLRNFTAASADDGAGILSARNVPLGTVFYIGVYADGDWNAVGEISVNAYDPANQQANPVELSDGLPINDILAVQEYRYYRYVLDGSEAISSLSFGVSSKIGDADFFVNGVTRPTFPRFDGLAEWSANDVGSDIITIKNPPLGIYRISVLAWNRDVQYQIIAVKSSGSLQMTDGVSYPAYLEKDDYAYYQFNVVDSTAQLNTSTLTFAARNLVDETDLDLYCSKSVSRPTNTSFTWSSTEWGRDIVIISGSKGELTSGMYYCGVHAYTTVSYHIIATLRSKALLQDGVNVEAQFIPAGASLYFYYDLNATSPDNFTVTTIPAFGQHQLYVSAPNANEPNYLVPSSYIARDITTSYRGHSVIIPSRYCNATSQTNGRCRYQILVHAITDTAFDIIAVSAGSTQQLISGQIVYGTSPAGTYRYFSFYVAHPNSSVTVMLSSTDGDPDLWVSYTNPHPTYEVSEWQARTGEGDVVTFDQHSPQLRNRSIVGTYYIAVHGFRVSTWDLRVKIYDPTSPDAAFPLANGIPVQFRLPYNLWDYYTFTFTAEQWPGDVVITLEPYSGDPDLYVSATTSRPSQTSALTWSSTNGAGSASTTDQVTIGPNTANACNPLTAVSRTCTYYIGVYAWEPQAINHYALVAHIGDTAILLSNGNSFERTLRANQAEYYVFLNTHINGTVVIGLTPFQGDPGLFVSNTANITRPNMTHYTYMSDNAGGDMVVINPARAPVYWIGVRPLRQSPSRYTILASSYDATSINANPVALVNGRPIPDFLGSGTTRHFYYTFTRPISKLTLFVHARIGDPDIFINFPGMTVYPNRTHANLTATNSGEDFVILRNPAPGTYRVSLYAWSDSSYQLSLLEGGSTQVTTDGVTYRGDLEYLEYDYYAYTVLPGTAVANQSLVFTGSALNGDVDVFCSTTTPNPTWANSNSYQWSSNSFDSDNIVITQRNGLAQGRTYYCGVLGYQASQYYFTASLLSPIRLTAGLPYENNQVQFTSQYYTYEMERSRAEMFALTITPSRGYAWLFVNTAGQEPDFDDATSYQYSSQIDFLQSQTILIPASTCLPVGISNLCTYSILVWARRDTSYSLIVETANSTTQMVSGVNYEGYVPSNQYTYYSFRVPEPRMRVSVQMTVLGGDPDLFISRTNPRPMQGTNEWSSEDSITFDWTHPAFGGGSMEGVYYVAVWAYPFPAVPASFRLLLLLTSEGGGQTIINLVPGQSQERQLMAGQYDDYTFSPSTDNWPYSIAVVVTPLSGDPNLYIDTRGRARANNATWTSMQPAGQPDMIWLVWNDTRTCNPTTTMCTYHIGVQSTAASSYSILLTLFNGNGSVVPIQLNNAVTLSGQITFSGGYTQYYFSPPTLGVGVVFIVTPLSGNPDLYASSSFPNPTAGRYEYASTARGSDLIFIPNATAPVYFLSVHAEGFQQFAFYSVVAQVYDPRLAQVNAIALSNGVAQNDFVIRLDYRYYTYTLTEPNTERLVVGIIPRTGGNPNLYVNEPFANGSTTAWPSTARFDHSSLDNNGFDVVGILNPRVGEYRIAVHGLTQSQYTITAVRSNTSLQLLHGWTYPGQLFRLQYAYYYFFVGQNDEPLAAKTLSITLAVKPGSNADPDLYCSDTIPNPTNVFGRYNWSSLNVGGDVLTLSGATGQLHVGIYYCAVYAFSDTTYTISAYLNARASLQDGVMQQSSVAAGELKYYAFDLMGGVNNTDLTITAMAYSGVSYLYVTKAPAADPLPNTYSQWSSTITDWVVQTIFIPREDCATGTRCTYNILVYSPNNPAQFTIVAKTGEAVTQLTSGIPVFDRVALNEYRYYTFTITQPQSSWSITTTADANRDVDLFVSRTNRRPSPSSREWFGGLAGGFEYVSGGPNDAQYNGGSTVGTYYVSALGFEPAEFVLTLLVSSPNNIGSVTLLDGQPQNGVVETGMHMYYTFTPSPVNWPYTVYISLHPITGDPDLYVRSDGAMANSSYYQVATLSGGINLDQIIFYNTSQYVCNPTRNLTANGTSSCHYSIAVRGFSASQYTITVSTSKSNERLYAGTPVGPRRLLAGVYDHYFFQNTVRGNTVMFSLIATSGNPNLYISTTNAFPNTTHYTWGATAATHDLIQLSNANATVYYVSVHADQGQAEYTLVATSYNASRPEDSVVNLYAGEPYQDVLAGATFRYFYFDLNSLDSTDYLYITVTHDIGDPDVYVNYLPDRAYWPRPGDAQWIGEVFGTDLLTIPAPLNGRYAIAVFAANGEPAAYRITVALAGTTQTLVAGVAYQGRLTAGQYNYYRFQIFQVQNNADLSFIVTPQSGDPNLYVSETIARPSITNSSSYRWSSAASGLDSVVLSNAREPGSVHTGTYYVAVYAQTDTQYSIVASYNSRIILSDGQSQYTYLANQGQQRYQLTLTGVAETVTIQTQQALGTINVYVGVNRDPVIQNVQTWDAFQGNTGNAFLQVPRARCNNVTCTYSILVQAAGNGPAAFYLTANTANNNLLLSSGVAISGTATSSAPNYYKLSITSMFANVSIQLTTTAGNADLYCSYRYPRPDASNYDWSSTSTAEEDRVYFDFTDPIFRTGVDMARMYYCAVVTVSPYTQSTYRLLYTATDNSGQDTSITRLSDGVPLQTSAGYQQFRYFEFSPSAAGYPYDIFFQLSAETGDPDMYIRNDGQLPSLNNWMWETSQDSTMTPVELLTIRANDSLACTADSVALGRCTYRIAVYAWGYATRFVITVSTSNPNTYTQLIEGVPVQGVVNSGQWHYYSFLQYQPGLPILTIVATALSGNPDLYYTVDPQRPNENSPGSREVGSDVVQFVARPARYNIGVRGTTTSGPSNYLLVATLGAIRLYNGQSQDDVLERGQSRTYEFMFSDSTGLRPVVIDVTSATLLTGVMVYVGVGGTVNATHYTWMSAGEGTTANTLTIMPNDPMYQRDGRYMIMVTSPSIRAVYSITASDGVQATTLVNGFGRLFTGPGMGEYRYFRAVAVTNQQDLQFGITAYNGAVSVFVSRNNRNPSSLNYTWTTSSLGGFGGVIRGLSIVVPKAEIVPGYYYIGVRTESAQPAVYTVLMTTTSLPISGNPITANPGTNSAATQQATCNAPRYYSMALQVTEDQLQDVTFMISPSDWSSAAYTGRFNISVSRVDPYPTPRTALWTSGANAMGISQQWTISQGNWELRACVSEGQRLGTGCVLYIAVTCAPPSSDTSYLLTVAHGNYMLPLVDGVPHHATLSGALARHVYVSYVTEANALLLIAETCRGHQNLYVSSASMNPGANTPNVMPSVKTLAGAVQSVFIPGPISNQAYYSAVQSTVLSTEYRMWSMPMHEGTTLKDIMPNLPSTTLSLTKDSEHVYVTFERATLPAMYQRPPTGTRYSIRYALYYATQMNTWSMHSECGLNRTILAERLSDGEVADDTGKATMTIPLANMQQESYKVSVLVQIFRQVQGRSTAMLWTTFDVETDVRPAELPLTAAAQQLDRQSSKAASGPAVALYVMIPVMFFVVMFAGRWLYKRRQSQQTPIPLELFGVETSSGSSDLPYKAAEDSDGVYTNGNTNGTHATNGTNGVNGHDQAQHGSSGVETGEPSYISHPTPDNNVYTQ